MSLLSGDQVNAGGISKDKAQDSFVILALVVDTNAYLWGD